MQTPAPSTDPSHPKPLTRAEKVLQREILPCDDPICSCEAEPRWLAIQETGSANELSEWEVLQRSPRDEL